MARRLALVLADSVPVAGSATTRAHTVGGPITAGAFALLLAGCSRGGDKRETNDLVRAALSPEITVEDLMKNAAEDQIALFRDGVIDFADYERATFAAIQCLEENGFQAMTAPRWDEVKQEFTYPMVPPPGGPVASAPVAFECAQKHKVYVQSSWEWRHAHTEQEIQAARVAVGDCLRAAGYTEIAGVPTEEEIHRLLRDESSQRDTGRCIFDIYNATGVRPY